MVREETSSGATDKKRNMDRLYGKRGAIEEGFPKAHEIFAGNRSDSTTRDPF